MNKSDKKILNSDTSIMQEKEKYFTFGIKSTIGEFIFKHPWHAMSILLAICAVLIFSINEDLEKQMRAIKVIIICALSITAIMRFIHKNTCYKIIIDKSNNLINFYLMFNQIDKNIKTEDIKVLINRNINLIANNKKYVIWKESLHDIVSLLPANTEINFIGVFGKELENELINTNKRLKPGSKL